MAATHASSIVHAEALSWFVDVVIKIMAALNAAVMDTE